MWMNKRLLEPQRHRGTEKGSSMALIWRSLTRIRLSSVSLCLCGKTTFVVALLALLVCSGCKMPDPFRVMSFNIRYGSADDGANSWPQRRELVFRTIRADDPDVIGLQEVLLFQANELRDELSDYAFIGAGRDDGAEKGEMAPIMYRKDTFDMLAYGHVWLAEDIKRPGVCSWDAACPRMFTWVGLRFRRRPLNGVIIVNTHFDHVGKQARLESAKIVRRMTDSLGGKPVVVLGDFNCGPESPPYNVLTGDRGNLAELRDAWAMRWRDEDGAGTFHGFTGEPSRERIDWILFNRRLEALDTAIDRREFNGRYPSDHFPVTATLRLLPATDTGAM